MSYVTHVCEWIYNQVEEVSSAWHSPQQYRVKRFCPDCRKLEILQLDNVVGTVTIKDGSVGTGVGHSANFNQSTPTK